MAIEAKKVWPWVAAACLAAQTVHAGAFDKELGSDAAALVDKVKLSMMNGNGDGSDSGRGPVPYYKALGAPPKRVALVSFYVWDCGNKRENHYNPVYRYKITRNVTATAMDAFASELYEASIAVFKEGFAAYGTQVLTAEEFLDTPEHQAAYDGFELQMGGMQKFFAHFQKSTDDTWRFTGVPDRYRLLQLVTIMDVKGNHFELGATGVGVGKLAKSLGDDLAKALGVDAVMILYNVVQGESKDIRMRGSYLYMFGPNPIADTGQSLYWSGHQYSGVYLRMDVPFVTTDKEGKLIEADYAGYAPVARALATRMGQHLKEKTSGAN
ncbi:MAG TPA: hypothetical protein VJS92_07865 [Candidatus Polarisedimenticolaceae bacterium]|nr:hypothetical protein [Candidatus Polarisedimenticolaceae bacterium]